MHQLQIYGWTDALNDIWLSEDRSPLLPARVTADFGTSVRIATPDILTAELSGKLAHHSSKLLVPKIGDWVAFRLHENGDAIVEYILPRRNEIARKAPGNVTAKQTIAANIDVAFVIASLDDEFNVDRIGRYVYQLAVSDIQAVIILNKTDKTDDIKSYIAALDSFDLPVMTMNATAGVGTDSMLTHIDPGKTAILLGSSGVGKSTVTNLLIGSLIQRTQTTRANNTGRHTTVHRELFLLPNGGLLVDTPGIRELQLWGTEEDLDDNYDDIKTLITSCRFRSCQHNGENGCAIEVALRLGILDTNRYKAYQKMKQEVKVLKAKSIARQKYEKRKPRRDNETDSRDQIADLRRGTY